MSVRISVTQLPKIDRIGLYPLENSSVQFTYRNPTNAIHLFEYNGRIVVDSREIEIQVGDITCIQHGSVYGIESPHLGKHWCVHYYDEPEESDPALLLPQHLRLGISAVLFREQFQLISSLHNGSYFKADTAPTNLEARFRLKAMLLGLINRNELLASAKRGAVNMDWDDLLHWIDQHLGAPINLETVAKMANLAPSTFSRKFKETHGAPFQKFVSHQRIDKAKRLLENTTMTIFETGAAVGIADPQYYNKQFRSVVGMSPTKYRELFRERMAVTDQQIATKDGQWLNRPKRGKKPR
jgi:AraC-like DNA-binding protein